MSDSRRPVVVLTGASKGIGLAVARILLETFSTNVITISRTRTPELVALVDQYPGQISTIECDVADEVAFTNAIKKVEETYGGIDSLILNAAVLNPMGSVTAPENTLDKWRSHFDVNFFSLITALRAALPALRKSDLGGRVVFVSSGSAVGGTSGWAPYNASKAALNSLCRTIANEEPGVVFVALRPGMVDTGMQGDVRANASVMTPQEAERFIKAHAEGALLKPEDPGHVIAALSVRAPRSLSGQFVSWDKDECSDFRRK